MALPGELLEVLTIKVTKLSLAGLENFEENDNEKKSHVGVLASRCKNLTALDLSLQAFTQNKLAKYAFESQ